MFIIENVITENCNLSCHYCVSGNTKIMMHDNTTKLIKDIQVGDKVLSINYENKLPYKEFKYNISTVSGLTKPRFVEKIYHIITENNNELYITNDHLVLTTRHKWKPIKNVIKSNENILYTVDLPVFDNKDFIYDEEYMIGYLTACWLGDGSFKKYFKSEKYAVDTHVMRFVVKDNDIMRYFKYCSEYFDYKIREYKFKISNKYDIYTLALIDRKKETYEKILELVENNLNKNRNENYLRGFLSGIYDCEGSFSDLTIRISNTEERIINQIKTALNYFGYKYKIVKNTTKRNKPLFIIYLYSKHRTDFLKNIYPHCKRKRVYNENYSLKKATKIKYAEEIDFNDYVYNIETDSHNYVANNIIVHNCYMKNNPNNMTMDTFKLILNNLDNVLKLYDQTEYHMDFFGGEPLLNWDLIKEATPMLQKDKRCKSFGIISNLLMLDEEKVKFIQDNKINVSFSFDGLWNEFNRPLKNGSSSLKAYEEKKDLIQQISPYGCKVMVSPSSLGTLVDNVKYLVEDWGFIRPDYSLVRDDIWTKEDVEKFRNEIRDLSNLQIEYIKKGKDVLIGFFRLYLLDMIFGKKYGKRSFGCFAGSHGMGIMPNGIGYPCARFGTSRKYPIYDFNNKTFYHENFYIFTKEQNKNPQMYDKCQNCYLYTYCNAGCTYSQMQSEYDFEPLDVVCNLYKILYDECLYVFDNLCMNDRFLNLLYPSQSRRDV